MSTISVTGHRPDKLGGYDNLSELLKLNKVAFNWLNENRPEGVLTGMALGWDQIIASVCLVLEIPYIACIPFKGQESMWPKKSQDTYNMLLEGAYKTIIVSTGKFSNKKMQIRNEYMVDNSDLLLSMWDGSVGGTGNCIKYAKSVNKPIINLYEWYKK